MEPRQALAILDQIIQNVPLTRAQHQQAAQAVNTLGAIIATREVIDTEEQIDA
jgi:hypothetical protein